MAGIPAFAPSKTVSAIESGRVRDTTYDQPVKDAYEKKGQVFEAEFPNDQIGDVRKGLARSALYLKVRLATDFEEITPDVEIPAKVNSKGEETAPATVKYGKTIVRFSAHDKMSRNGSRKPKGDNVETATDENPAVETADA